MIFQLISFFVEKSIGYRDYFWGGLFWYNSEMERMGAS